MSTEKTYQSYINTESSDEIVISGIAGRFPGSDNIKQLQENLFNKINLLKANHPRWNIEHSDLPTRMGTINNLEKFDADFFDISFKQANILDPMIRMLLEHTYEAIIDAGINPKQLRGKNTAVIIGTSFLESQETFLYKNLQIDDGNIAGCTKYAAANTLSHLFHLKGPSYTMDSACSSSLYAIAVAYDCIMSGRCEDAIVGATNLCLHPIPTMQYFRLGVLSSDGYCRPFDVAASGYSRSETVSVVYLQKAKNAKRIYAICKQIKLNNDGYKEQGILFPSTHMHSALLTKFYNECEVPPSYLDYIEAHGTATRAGDPEEINAIRNVLCQNRKTPLMVGSVKSNLGHAEPASGITQIAKVIIAFETGFVPPNINFTSPRNDIDALMDGSIRVITEAMPLKNGYVGINSFGFGGANAHMLLQWNVKKKINNGVPTDDLPRLVILSGRTEDSVKLFLNDIVHQPIDVEYIRLLHDIHTDDIDGHSWRGYIILNSRQKDSIQKIQKCKSIKRSTCFIFSAFAESKWPEMGKELLKFNAFANAIKMCDNILKPYNISITNILTKMDVKLKKSTLQTFVGIIAIQIGLVDLLTSVDIIPDYIIGHFGGELGCAYADGCLTMEQTILSAYFIGLACVKEKLVHSSIAVVNLDYKSLKGICPADIEIICRNNHNSNIVTGPVKSMQEFLRKLQNNNINVKAISCNNIPHHSHYLASLESQFFTSLNEIISQPKERSPKWISTSVPRNKWSDPASKLCSANYHTRSILNTVLFNQTTHMIPDNAVIIEIAPVSILHDILIKSVHFKVTNIVLTKQNEQNAITLALQGIGELYNCGLQPRLANLYPLVNFPVSRGTPMISPLIRWDHSEDWFVSNYQKQNFIKSRQRQIKIKVNNEDYSYMIGHYIDGKNLLPATCYLVLVWETIGMIKNKIYTSIPIIFQDIKFIRATYLSNKNSVNLTITIQKKSGKFEVIEGDSVVVTGEVHAVSNTEQEMVPNDLSVDIDEEEHMTSRDIYKELRLRGYQYSGEFCGLNSASISGSKGHVTWTGNWVTFMDNMLQMAIIEKDTRNLYISTSIEKLVINPALHASKLRDVTSEKDKQIPIRVYKEIDVIKSGGIEIRGLKTISISRRKPIGDPVIEEHKFIAHQDCADISLNEAIRISTQLALEDHQIIKATAIELVENTDNVRGDLSSFCWMENDISIDSDGKDIVRVIYSSINFKDVMLATGKLTSDIRMSRRLQSISLGFEYVGFDVNGQRVMGLCDNKCIANVIVRDKDLCWNIPDSWTFEEAATVPCIYSTNYYALYHFGKMKKGDKILIHSGTGGIGQSAIHLALQEGCQVFTTVGTAEKRKFIRKLFPAIPDKHIGNSRDTSFEQMIMRQTNGRGVDIVLNSLAEEKLIASVRCLAKRGRFLEIGKFDISSNNSLNMSFFQKGISFYPVLLDAMFTSNHKNKYRLSKLMAEGLKYGNIKPIQMTVFPKTEIEAAFRYMASGKHMGKIILNIQEDVKSLDSSVVAHRHYYCFSDRSYVILGGLGGFGLELTDWLILRGARNVILTSRTGIKNGYQRMRIELWKSYGVNVQIIKNANLANPEKCEHFLQMAEKQAPVDAIFNLAVVLKNCLLKNQTMETFTESFMSKAWTTQTLDKVSRKMCLKLRHFVVFSSVSCGKGNAGLTNYGMANSIMERVCEKRAEEGLPGLAIQWGAVGDVGLVADMQENNKELVIGGTLQQKISSCLVELEKFLLQNQSIVSSMIVSEKKTGLSGLDNMVEAVVNIMNIKDIKVISQNTPLAELGMDSMMAVEIRQTLEREFDILLTAQEVRNLTFAKLSQISNAKFNSNKTQTKAATDKNKSTLTKEWKLFGVLRNQDFISEICLDLATNRMDNSTIVFLLPGIDSRGTIFNHLALRIKFLATSLQYGNIGDVNTVSEMADYLLMCISSRLRDKKEVVVTGYSFGSILAIELIRRLETMGTKSRLVLIDGAPEYIMRSELNKFCYMSDKEIQIDIMIVILKIYETEIGEEILLELRKCETWEERFEVFAKYFLKENSLLSRPNLQTLYATIYKNILFIRQYDSSTLPRIKSSITLLKPTLSYAPEFEEDYGLYKITENKVVVHYVEGNHVTILGNEKVAAVINEEAF
nr:PREDICTED: fatty acid synthase-like [Linepithema humile]